MDRGEEGEGSGRGLSIEARELLGRRTIIYGEAGSGKTRLLARLLEELKQLVGDRDITVIDLAPGGVAGVGRALTDFMELGGVRYLRPSRVYAPRLMACNADDLHRHVRHNVEEANILLRAYFDQPTKHLAINDLTIYLHGADVDELENYIAPAETFIATAYYGHRLDQDYGTDLSRLERLRVEKLLRRVDRAILIN
jgi:serine kinase of HPr protein (carbohydrate metabolism regulator)